jgi:hypothetical protein
MNGSNEELGDCRKQAVSSRTLNPRSPSKSLVGAETEGEPRAIIIIVVVIIIMAKFIPTGASRVDVRMSTTLEAIRLYRDILRACRLFVWEEPGSRQPWGKVLAASARKEFEQARHERDPMIIHQLLVGGRDALTQTLERVHQKQQSLLTQPDGSQRR